MCILATSLSSYYVLLQCHYYKDGMKDIQYLHTYSVIKYRSTYLNLLYIFKNCTQAYECVCTHTHSHICMHICKAQTEYMKLKRYNLRTECYTCNTVIVLVMRTEIFWHMMLHQLVNSC